jgi:hypothetical protein
VFPAMGRSQADETSSLALGRGDDSKPKLVYGQDFATLLMVSSIAWVFLSRINCIAAYLSSSGGWEVVDVISDNLAVRTREACEVLVFSKKAVRLRLRSPFQPNRRA